MVTVLSSPISLKKCKIVEEKLINLMTSVPNDDCLMTVLNIYSGLITLKGMFVSEESMSRVLNMLKLEKEISKIESLTQAVVFLRAHLEHTMADFNVRSATSGGKVVPLKDLGLKAADSIGYAGSLIPQKSFEIAKQKLLAILESLYKAEMITKFPALQGILGYFMRASNYRNTLDIELKFFEVLFQISPLKNESLKDSMNQILMMLGRLGDNLYFAKEYETIMLPEMMKLYHKLGESSFSKKIFLGIFSILFQNFEKIEIIDHLATISKDIKSKTIDSISLCFRRIFSNLDDKNLEIFVNHSIEKISKIKKG